MRDIDCVEAVEVYDIFQAVFNTRIAAEGYETAVAGFYEVVECPTRESVLLIFKNCFVLIPSNWEILSPLDSDDFHL